MLRRYNLVPRLHLDEVYALRCLHKPHCAQNARTGEAVH